MASLDDARKTLDSQFLYKLCQTVGFSRTAWKNRLVWNDVLNTCNSYICLFGQTQKNYTQHSGSSSEGVAMTFLGSDIDVMMIPLGTRVIDGCAISHDAQDDIYKIILSQHSAFVRLNVLHMGVSTESNFVRIRRCCVVDQTGNLVLSSTLVKQCVRVCGRPCITHGPAATISESDMHGMLIDFVFSLHCETWPESSKEWIQRHRPNTWPTPDLIGKVTEQGCELVPVGNPESEERELEWRLSSSQAEKILIRTFSTVQIQCYFLLKLILAFLIKPYVKDALSSYHMKNIMLHVVENTDPREWRANNLTCCFMTCLQTLLLYLEVGYFPQYFILTHNLLRPKIQGETHQKILEIVKELYSEGWRFVLRCAPFSYISLSCGHQYPMCPCHIQHWGKKSYFAAANGLLETVVNIHIVNDGVLQTCSMGDFLATLNRLLEVITYRESDHKAYFPSAEAAKLLRKLLRCHMGYMLLYCNTQNQHTRTNRTVWKIMRISRTLLEENCDVDLTSCRLKLATFYYQTGQVGKCILTVQNVLGRYENTMPNCEDSDRTNTYIMHPQIHSIMSMLQPQYGNFSAILSHMAFPVTFSPWEILSAPVAVQKLAVTKQFYPPHDKKCFKLLHIDSVVYSYFLLFICFLDRANYDQCCRSLDILRRVVRDPERHMLYYPEIASQLTDFCQTHYRQHIV